jgi:hypothetical protein
VRVPGPRGMLRILGWVFLLSMGCTPAERAALGVPVLSQIDAIGSTLAQAVGWCSEHGASPESVLQARQAIADKDPGSAVDVVRKMLEASAKAGEPIPPDVVALVQTVEGALAAQSIQNGMRALSGTPP